MRLDVLALGGLAGLVALSGSASAEEAGQQMRRSLRSLQREPAAEGDKDISISLPGVGSINVGSNGISTSPPASSTSGPSTDSNSPINYHDYIHGRGINTADGSNPVCRMQSSMDKDGTVCLAAASWLAFTKAIPPPLGVGYAARPPVDRDNKLPAALKDQRPLPATIDGSVVTDEKPTYYWYYRLLMNFYAELADWSHNGVEDIDLKVPSGWEHQRFYNTSMRRTAPLGASYVKDGHYILLLRGTMFSEEWERDFQYYFADKDDTAKFFPGRVHAGFFSVFNDLAGDVAEELNLRQPTRVTVAGHSLGGAVANLVGYFIANSTIKSNITVDVVSFGAPQVGDEDFVDDFNIKVNNRHLAYRGSGSSSSDGYYEVGDFIAQSPCGSISNCPLLTEFSARREGESYNYTAVGGDVPFVYSDLRNGDTWRLKGDVTSFFYAPLANHVCSYLCFLAGSAGDKDEKCYFPLDWEPDVLVRYRCPLLM